jgi:predicted dehydrogenase
MRPERVVEDFREVLARVDAADVVTPADSHLAIASTVLEAGRHCFIEKPLALTVAQGRQLARLALPTGQVLQVGHIFRFHPVTDVLRNAIMAGHIGAIRFGTSHFAGFKRPRIDVGVTHTDAIHFFDLFAHLLCRYATAVMALQRDYLGRGLDDVSVTVVQYGDVPVLVEANYFVPGTHRQCVIVGDKGSLLADYTTHTVTLHAGYHSRRSNDWEAVDLGAADLITQPAEPLRLQLEAFIRACVGRGPVVVDAEAGVHALEIAEAAARASRLGRTVALEEVGVCSSWSGPLLSGRQPADIPETIGRPNRDARA